MSVSQTFTKKAYHGGGYNPLTNGSHLSSESNSNSSQSSSVIEPRSSNPPVD